MRYIGLALVLASVAGSGCAQMGSGGTAGEAASLSRAPAEGYASDIVKGKRPTIIAHRGMHHVLPENSVEAMVAAWKAGIEWCECDVYLSSDGVAVLMHDATLDRTTEAKGEIAKRSWAELKQIRLKNANGSLSKYRIPSLEQALAAMPEGCAMLIELKTSDNEPLVRETLRLAEGRKCVIQSFDAANVRHAMRLGKLPVAYLAGKPETLEIALAGEWPAINISHDLLTPEVARRAREQGKSLGVWTVDEPEDLRRVLSVGTERIITDYPKWMREAMR